RWRKWQAQEFPGHRQGQRMSTRKSKAPESSERLDQAEDVAASIDAPAAEAVKQEVETGAQPEEAVDDALEAAAMVAEGGAVAPAAEETPSAASLNGDVPGDAEPAAESDAAATVEMDSEAERDAPAAVVDYGPVSD